MAVASQPDPQKALEEASQWIQQQYESEKARIPMPAVIPAQALAASDREAVKKACLSEIYRSAPSWNGKNALSAIEEFVEFCALLSQPENHIKGRTGQFVEKQVNTRTFVDMEAEVAWELTNLPHYTAYVKITKEQAGKQIVLKRKIHTYPLPRVPAGRDVVRTEKAILQQSYARYYRRRPDIEGEISQRQQGALAAHQEATPPTHIKGQDPSALAATDPPSQGVLSPSSKPPESDLPPPSSVSHGEGVKLPESVEHKTGNNPGEKGLIYHSNFYLPDDRWIEKETDGVRKFRRDGYYHIELSRSSTTIELIEIPATDFKVYVDAQVLKGEAVYGVCFRGSKNSHGLSFYLFALTPASCGLLLYRNGDYTCLLDNRSSGFIRQDSVNSLTVQMTGREITLGINGQILATATDNRLTSGYAGLVVKKEGDALVEVRFRNFQLYSLE